VNQNVANEPKLPKRNRPPGPGSNGSRATLEWVRYLFGIGRTHVPPSLNWWEYRTQLARLDAVLLEALRFLGAESPSKVAGWVNEHHRIKLDSANTGIAVLTADTVSDWGMFAWRRGLVCPWPDPQETPGRDGQNDRLIQITDKGLDVLRSPLERALTQARGAIAVIGASGIAAAYSVLAQNPELAVVIGIIAGYVGILALSNLVLTAWIKRRMPAVAVVLIESLRSQGPAPSL
jgi:hypothetical protein